MHNIPYTLHPYFLQDVDVLDSLLSDSLRMTIMILGTVFGSVIVIAVFFPYFLIAVGVIIFGTTFNRSAMLSADSQTVYRLCVFLGAVQAVGLPCRPC